MVQIKARRKIATKGRAIHTFLVAFVSTAVFCAVVMFFDDGDAITSSTTGVVKNDKSQASKIFAQEHGCSYQSLNDLKPYERFPKASSAKDGNGRRHMVDPPKDGKVTLVCCELTKGSMSIAIHHNWAPRGAQRFLDMVKDEYFSSKVAMMRCIKNFLCQFGIAGDPSLNKKYKSFEDDPNWLPEGPTHMTNEYGTFRYARGYLGYAGGGKNSRSQQFIVALNDHKRLGGGSPWEVPWGEIVGEDSYETLSKISYVYGENGPSQKLLHKKGSSQEIADKFPELDYMTSCVVVDEADFS
ncbi:hypothetical protein CTEN210_10500 [Chaetoceros tenuissimus]|uniref:PPIase cyclophilin-type domain-containing protein n=1 Tax=Chaetoceros tenuissimus TaxID=426638 RepID=A0AAD3CY15_9STRA|nr:hypothetical protein CTEN210_10500 [Chaetoceros tenuissimus]